MIPTWTQVRCLGYEVKVSRRDFINDNKWMAYLPFCTEFYFVCPANLIQPDELPDGVGLLWTSSTGTKLYQKRKAIPRDIEPENLSRMLRSVLMWRFNARERGNTPQEWLAGRAERSHLAHQSSQLEKSLVHALEENRRAVMMKHYGITKPGENHG